MVASLQSPFVRVEENDIPSWLTQGSIPHFHFRESQWDVDGVVDDENYNYRVGSRHCCNCRRGKRQRLDDVSYWDTRRSGDGDLENPGLDCQ